MDKLLEKVAEFIEARGLIAQGQRLLVAASGGADSTCLLHVLRALAPTLRLDLHAAHLDHGLRGRESEEDRRFVETMCSGLGIPCHTGTLPPGSLRRKGISLQESAREARYAFLSDVAARTHADRVALGHTADDQAEEVLMRLLRGAGMAGLSGIPARRGIFVRPLLSVTRAEVEAWLAKRGISWREDSSNAGQKYLRNRVRNRLLRDLEAYNPRVREALLREAAILGDEDSFLEELARGRFEELAAIQGGAVRFDLTRLSSEHPAIQRRLVRLAFERAGGSLRGLTLRHVEAVLGLLGSESPSARVKLPGGMAARRRYGALEVASSEPKRAQFRYELALPGRIELPEAGAALSVWRVEDGEIQAGKDVACFPLDRLSWPLIIRSVRPGDSFRPRGLGGTKKLSDLFIDLKVPRDVRRRVPVLETSGRILWVCGLRESEEAVPCASGVICMRLEELRHPG
jgi:tRNA(Ile)-lysidine synthase